MADTVVVDNGALTDYTVAADEVQVGGSMALAQVQYVKLVDGTLNGTDGIPGSTATGLLVNTELPAAAALADAMANPTAPAVGSHLMAWNGATWDRVFKSSENALYVHNVLESTLEYDTVGGGWSQIVVGLAVPSATGSVAITGDAANGLDVDVTRLPSIPAGTNNIGDVDVLTVPAPLSTTGGGTEAAALRVTLANDSTGLVSIDDNGGSITVDGTVAVSGSVTVDSELPAAAALADNFANPTAPAVGACMMVWDSATWDRAPGNASVGMLVNGGGNVFVAAGPAAHDAPISGAPVRVGARAVTADVTAVATGDTVDAIASVTGKPIVLPYCIPELALSGVASATGTGDTSVIAAQGAGVKIYITTISVANSSAVDTIVEIKSATTVIWRTIAAAKGGSNIPFPVPISTAANAALNFACLTAGTTVYFSAAGYKGV